MSPLLIILGFLMTMIAMMLYDDYYAVIENFRSFAAPMFPDDADLTFRSDYITGHEHFQTWSEGRGPRILNIHGTGTASEDLGSILRCLDMCRPFSEKKKPLIHFNFMKHDDRYNSVSAMLNTLLAQIFTEDPTLFRVHHTKFEQMAHYSSWSQGDLWLLLQDILLSNSEDEFFCLVGGMNECDESRVMFLEDLAKLAERTERGFKFLIFSGDEPDLQAALIQWPAINLNDDQENHHKFDHRLLLAVHSKVLEISRKRPELYFYEKSIMAKLAAWDLDSCWRDLVLKVLESERSRRKRISVLHTIYREATKYNIL